MIVSLKNNTAFECTEGETIVQSGLRQNIFLPHSCLNGRCNSCRAKILSGRTEAKYPEIGLTEFEKLDGYILPCIHIPKTDVRIDIEDFGDIEFFPARTFPAKINNITYLTDDILRLELRFPPSVPFRYIPGQYINILKDDYKRSYSIANAQGENGLVLYIKRYANGRFSEYIFNQAAVNDLLRIEGPLGTFVFRKQKARHIIFLATGTGLAPVRSIVSHLIHENGMSADQKISIFYGVRQFKELIWEPETVRKSVSFYPILSQPDPDWTGQRGYVQYQALERLGDFSESVVYACGSEAMIHDALHLLSSNGLNPADFYSDAFVISS